MIKDEILAKSRNENKNGDEREEKIRLRSYAISAVIGASLCMVFVLIENAIFDRNATMMWIIYFGMIFSKSLLDAIKLKTKSDILFSILWGICFLIDIVVYILDNIGG